MSSSDLERMATFTLATSQRLADAARTRRHEPRVPAHTLRSQRRAGLQKMRRGSFAFPAPMPPQPMDSSSFTDGPAPAPDDDDGSASDARRRSSSYEGGSRGGMRSSTRIAALQLSPRSRPEPPELRRGNSE